MSNKVNKTKKTLKVKTAITLNQKKEVIRSRKVTATKDIKRKFNILDKFDSNKELRNELKKRNIQGRSKFRSNEQMINAIIKDDKIKEKQKKARKPPKPLPKPPKRDDIDDRDDFLRQALPFKEDDTYTGPLNVIIRFTDRGKLRTNTNILDVINKTRDEIRSIVETESLAYFNDFGYAELTDIHDLGNDPHYPILQSIDVKAPQHLKGNFKDMVVAKVIFNKLNLNIKSNEDIITTHCVTDYIINRYKNIKGCIKEIKKVEHKTKWTVDELLKLLERCKIPYKCVTQTLKNYKEFDVKNRGKKKFFFIASNEHIYPVTKKELSTLYEFRSSKDVINNIKYVEDINMFVKNNITEKQIKKFSLDFDDIEDNKDFYKTEYFTFKFTRVLIDDILYVDCKETVEAYELFKNIIGFFPLSYGFKMYDPLIYLCKLNGLYSTYDCNIDKSYAVSYSDLSVRSHINGQNILNAIDKNRCFTSSLYDLEYLTKINSSCFVRDYMNEKINENYYYYIDDIRDCNNDLDRKPFMTMIKKGWCTGKRFIGLEKYVNIKYEMKPILIKNPIREIIPKMLELNSDLSKTIINMFSGVISITDPKYYYIYENLTNSKDEATIYENPVKISDLFYANQKIIKPSTKFKESLKPISVQIIDNSIYNTRRKLLKLYELDENIKIRAIKTDCIVFHSEKIKLRDLDLDKNDFKKWKKEEIKSLPRYNKLNNNNVKFNDYENIMKIKLHDIDNFNNYLDSNLLFDCMAGCGKTYTVINYILPKIKDKKVLVIATKHSALLEYYQNNIKAKVIHYFIYNGSRKYDFRKYDYIIVDECGLLEHNHYDYMYKNMGANTKFIFLGDNKQLLPFGTKRKDAPPLWNSNIIKLFKYRIIMTDNYRNNYTKKQYYDMINLKYKITNFEKKLFNRYGNFNISMTLKKRDEVNKYYIKNWVDEFAGLKVKKGGHLICEFSNKDSYAKFSKLELYNGTSLIIEDYNNEKITLKCKNTNKIFIIDKDLFRYNFNYGYCITSFRAQGLSIPYKDLGLWEMEKIKKDGRQLYTVLSRIKTKLINKPKPYIEKEYILKNRVNIIKDLDE